MAKIIFLFFAVSLSLLESCSNNGSSNVPGKVYKEKYYASGELLNKGWYINDTIPVDTIFEYEKNGKLASIAVYNNNGRLTGGSEVFFENGNKHQINNFLNDQLQGFSYEFRKDGSIYNKVFYLNGKQTGDYYEYDNKGRLSVYAFYWDDSSPTWHVEYDSLGKIKDQAINNRSALFSYKTLGPFDTLFKDQKMEKFEVQLIVSNPPKCKTKVYIDFISDKDNIIKRDSIINLSYYLQSYYFSDSVKHIKYTAIQFDSSLNKYYKFGL